MCGIAGFLGKHKDPISLARSMASKIKHRGPDDCGYWVDTDIALAHQRLSVVDISALGHQPMLSESARFVICFNGEIYNHLELRSRIQKNSDYMWKGRSDTETLLAAIEKWGIKKALSNLIGMFAFAVWDRKNKVLTLARDRAGEKPLYYGNFANTIIFGSELKALTAHPSFIKEIDPDALALYMRHAYVPSPYSIYRGIKKLPAGTLVEITKNNISKPVQYWSAADVFNMGQKSPCSDSDQIASAGLENLLKKVIKSQMVADVPVGAFLSGGVDSSTIVALMQSLSSRQIKTYSIGFDNNSFDEARYARLVAKHLGCEHTELYVGSKIARDVIPILPVIYDEPFADSSQIPTYLVSKLARKDVTVSLSGDGADELFGGYNRYLFTANIWKYMSITPYPLREFLAKSLSSIPSEMWNNFFEIFNKLLPKSLRLINAGAKAHKFSGILTANSPQNLYGKFTSFWDDPVSLVRFANKKLSSPSFIKSPKFNSSVEYMMYADLMTYLPDDILVKIDRAAMAVSLETRVPFLDCRIIDFSASLPLHMKIRNGHGKWILRDVLSRYIPNSLIDRPKMGFSVPLDEWLRGPLREWAEDLLSEQALSNHGHFYIEPIRAAWKEHLLGLSNQQFPLWNVLMFQAWIAEQSTS
jgi:asparagine synthase (glutamine-hydrolysing)